jgi:hypothetical protein
MGFRRYSHTRRRWSLGGVALLAATVGAAVTVAVPTATADSSFWGCTTSSAAVCWESPNYRGWVYVKATMTSGAVKSELCAKGVTANGNQRGGGGCSFQVNQRISCFGAAEPTSRAYVYWGGSGGATGINGEARTPSSNQFPCT